MRVALVAVCTAAGIGFPVGVVAAPSNDLVFCSKLGDKTERIACYDAAARIAETKQRFQAVVERPPRAAAPTIVPAHDAYASKAPVMMEAQRQPFRGAYAGLGGSYGISSSRDFAVNGLFQSGADVQPQGASVVGAIGYNLSSGPWIFGIEFDGRYGHEKAALQRGASFPSFFSFNHTYRYRNDIGVHVSARGGLTFDDTLIFAKLGVGAARLVEHYAANDSDLFFTCSSGVRGE